MELWIRSQNKKILTKIDTLRVGEKSILDKDELVNIWGNDIFALGGYKTNERALEVLDEIQNRFRQTFICDLKCPVYKRDYENIKSGLEHEYPSKEFIIQPQHYELKPINSDVVIYEMPEE